ncbi:hydroxyacylglutathione hydrolase [Paracoccus aerodenitrificans]|uniref:hydroxyacylglutathione hydrolase n=1 Tax=Paracoccus aerodenitrificans TaxID=3017781 RepID=UPI0022F0C937|nr:hydroxyacylglutathione hydrolase [Paracoccus aerodenitrificans]WBU62641.1 hydroxyacylglutathione hydrolase [Paracoccus aerodenitrificans]
MSDTEIVTVRCLQDNYAYLLRANGMTALFDAPEPGPILDALSQRGWTLDQILLTHHHGDHIDGVTEIVSKTGASVTGARADAHRLPDLDIQVNPGETTEAAGLQARVIDVSGHTVGHIAFYLPDAKAAFTGDSLMALGCGRIFEGDAAMMWDSLIRLNALPEDTLICSGHDYCAGNGAFASSVDPDNPELTQRIEETANSLRPCAPATLKEERLTNPFLRAPELAESLGEADAAAAFARLRKMKDNF